MSNSQTRILNNPEYVCYVLLKKNRPVNPAAKTIYLVEMFKIHTIMTPQEKKTTVSVTKASSHSEEQPAEALRLLRPHQYALLQTFLHKGTETIISLEGY